MNKRNPTWARDELILALDLYVNEGQLGAESPEVIELSKILNALPIHTNRPDLDKFRNPNGVALKLANFRAIDPNDPAAGMSSGGKGDKLVWQDFSNNLPALKLIATAIKNAVANNTTLPSHAEDDEDTASEGKILFRMHRTRERDTSIVKKKKQKAIADNSLYCEVCGFDFLKSYGPHGKGYIECHHIVPICQENRKKTTISDLALVCANCHRMLHRGNPWPSVSKLQEMYNKSFQGTLASSRP